MKVDYEGDEIEQISWDAWQSKGGSKELATSSKELIAWVIKIIEGPNSMNEKIAQEEPTQTRK